MKVILEIIKKKPDWWVYQKIGTRVISCAILNEEPVVEKTINGNLIRNSRVELYGDQVITVRETRDTDGKKVLNVEEVD